MSNILRISWKEQKTNKFAKDEMKRRHGNLESLSLPNMVKNKKLKRVGHISRKKGQLVLQSCRAQLMEAEQEGDLTEFGLMASRIGREEE